MSKLMWNLACNFKPKMIKFCQRQIQDPALFGQEAAVAAVYVKETKRLGYDRAFIDNLKNAMGIIQTVKESALIFLEMNAEQGKG